MIKSDDAPDYDPWAVIGLEEQTQHPRFSYLEKENPIRPPPTLREAPISLAKSKKAIPAIGTPKPGTSYNPTFQDWDALIISEGAKEVEAEKKRFHEAAVEQARLERIAAVAKEVDRSEYDDLQTEEESAWEGFESEHEGAHLTKKRPERKTPAERNRIKRRKERERREVWEKKEKEREKQQRQIAEIIKRAKQDAKAMARTEEESSEEDAEIDEQVLRRRRFGKDALPEPPLELVLPDELPDSLRSLKPEGNLLRDRFRNILVRGKMETRKPIQQPKKKRRIVTEKWSFKDFAVPA